MTDTPTIAALMAALESARWYSVNASGLATLCRDERDANATAADCNLSWPMGRPHRAMQLIDAAPARALVAELDSLRSELATQTTRADVASECAAQYAAERDILRHELGQLRHDYDRAVKLADDRLAQMQTDRAQALRWRDDAEQWQALYRRALNEANGLTNYVEDRPELRSAERRLTAIESEARTAIDNARAAVAKEPT